MGMKTRALVKSLCKKQLDLQVPSPIKKTQETAPLPPAGRLEVFWRVKLRTVQVYNKNSGIK